MYNIFLCQFKGGRAAFIQEGIRKILHMFKMHSSFSKNLNILAITSSRMSQETANWCWSFSPDKAQEKKKGP